MSATETTATPSNSKAESTEQAQAPTPSVDEKSQEAVSTPKVTKRVARLTIDFYPSPKPAEVSFEGAEHVPTGHIARLIPRIYRAIGQSKSAAIHKLRIVGGK